MTGKSLPFFVLPSYLARISKGMGSKGIRVLGEPYVAVLQLDADCGVAVDVLQPGDGDVSSV